MAEPGKTYRVFISAAEPSADIHCANLINALNNKGYDFKFAGVGGPAMEKAGCHLLENTAAKAAMIYKAFSHIVRFGRLLLRIKRYFKRNKVDMVIVCDSPAFNFHVAKAAKKAGIKTVFYVAPQLWAWAPWRIKKLKKCCDKLCCILPFEQDWFRQKGVDTVFVGNPLLDGLGEEIAGFEKKYDNFEAKNVKIALMPGSRIAEIESLWKPMQEIANRIKRKYPGASFTTVAVDEEKKQLLKSTQTVGFRGGYSINSVVETSRNSDFTVVASGSATLQVAAAGCPMVVIYQSSKTLWHLVGRHIINSKYLSLVNILAGKELVPEFMPYFESIEPITQAIEKLLEDKNKLAQTSRELIQLTKPLAQGNASEKTAQIVIDML